MNKEKVKLAVLDQIESVIKATAKADANSACNLIWCQPKMPKQVQNLSTIK